MDIRIWFVVLNVKIKPVDRKIRILRTLLSDDMTVNNIFVKTGLSDKKSITDAITEMEVAELIAERKHQKHSQKEIMYLTKSGRELADMIISLDEYIKSIYELHEQANEKVLFVKGRYLAILQYEDIEKQKYLEIKKDYLRTLRNIGWKDSEIEFYNCCRTNIVDFIAYCEKNFLNVLLLRYSNILRSFKLKKLQKFIIREIIMAAVNERISFMLEHIEDQIYGYSTIRVHNPLQNKIMPTVVEQGSSDGILQLFRDIVDIVAWNPLPFVIKEEIRNVLISFLSLLNPPLTNLDLYISDLINLAKKKVHFLEVERKHYDKNHRLERLSCKGLYFFLQIYKEYCAKRNFECVYLQDPLLLTYLS